jgi:hypothetical protein
VASLAMGADAGRTGVRGKIPPLTALEGRRTLELQWGNE